MRIKELATVERDIHVAPCLECGCADIQLSDSNYSSFNIGGGKCKGCGHEVTGNVSCSPTLDAMAAIWNAANDIPTLISAEEKKIAEATDRISMLQEKLAPIPVEKPADCQDNARLNTFSFRAECHEDVMKVLWAMKCHGFGFLGTIDQITAGLPDFAVEAKVEATLDQLLEIMRKIEDSHVMLQTLRQLPLGLNSLERDCEQV